MTSEDDRSRMPLSQFIVGDNGKESNMPEYLNLEKK